MKQIEFKEQTCWRIIPSRYPPINLFERVSNPEDLEGIFEIESLTNDRLRDEVGDISLVPKAERITGPGSSFIMAAFTHLNPLGSRFSNGSWGIYYAALELETSISETKYHREKFLGYTKEEPIHLDMRVLASRLTGDLDDLLAKDFLKSEIYNANDYTFSQKFGQERREEGSNGLYYKSVRKKNGKNVAVFKPRILSSCTQERHLEYVWDGAKILVYEKKLYA